MLLIDLFLALCHHRSTLDTLHRLLSDSMRFHRIACCSKECSTLKWVIRVVQEPPHLNNENPPFCVWRNQKNDPRGSRTNAFENYSGLFSDVILWTEKGWVDYMLPQLYLRLDHKTASSLRNIGGIKTR